MPVLPTIPDLLAALDAKQMSSVEVTRMALDRLLATDGEGSRIFTMIDPDRSIAQAERADRARAEGAEGLPLLGVPVSIKALFDLKGKVTTAGSKVLADAPCAKSDAEAVRRLRAAGCVIIGHTNMTEFAYSGIGLNPHYGTPGNPADRRRVPGGSSSGAAVSVADGMACMGLGTDTGGSCRIPAAFTGLTGFKPTQRRVPLDGAYPLSVTLDSIGPIARSVTCCALSDAVLSGDMAPVDAVPLKGLRIGILTNYVQDGMEPEVAAAFEAGLTRLASQGVSLSEIRLDALDRMPGMGENGGIVAAEAMAVHHDLLTTQGDRYDQRVRVRIEKARAQSPGDHDRLLGIREGMIRSANDATAGLDAVVMPTTPIVAPVMARLEESDDAFGTANLLALRNPTVANMLDRCAISLPLPVTGLPVGLMLMGETMGDKRLLSVAAAIERGLTA